MNKVSVFIIFRSIFIRAFHPLHHISLLDYSMWHLLMKHRAMPWHLAAPGAMHGHQAALGSQTSAPFLTPCPRSSSTSGVRGRSWPPEMDGMWSRGGRTFSAETPGFLHCVPALKVINYKLCICNLGYWNLVTFDRIYVLFSWIQIFAL